MPQPEARHLTPAHPRDWRAELRARGLRLTPQRRLVLQAVETLRHATPEEILTEVRRHHDAINLSTVYRNLEVLEELGAIRHTHLSDRAPTYHAVTDHDHFHLVCRGCGEVTSVELALAASLGDTLREQHGFTADLGHLALFGRCAGCASETSAD
ncbi:Fur family transcriptional regulator [Nocardioides massiliensis]|uniref:Fur family ferric uptake transcriptional regulator n=1 Tax=Nocardioides massiliensis TaxID=1325935 RepID=A0ABT9NNJ8_9ACTN|nr:transcriptional repressor [Nocardioides massiliensis]MDP9821774.1 Fur family ferric uptake transcriptional regulator [Nocardioides massiliensis]